MRSRTATWFVCGIRYEKTMEDGLQKKVTENYVIDALSFTEAEERITKELFEYISGEYDVKTCAIAPFTEILFAETEMADKWFKAKVDFINIDDNTGKEKRSHVYYLVQAGAMASALHVINTILGGSMIDYVVMSLQETNYIDVFEYKNNEPIISNAIDELGKDGGSETEA